MPMTPGGPADARRPSIWLGMLILYLVWGSTYLAIAVAVDTIPAFFMAAVRFLVAGLVLFGWSVAREGRSFHLPTTREWRDSAIVGALLLGGGMGLVAFGEQTVPSGITALLIGMMPVWVAILGRIFLGDRLARLRVVGIVVGFAGVAILIAPSAFGGTGSLEPLGLAAIVASPIAWSIGSLFASRRATLPRRPLVATGAQMICGGLVLFAMSAISGELADVRVETFSTESLLALGYLTVIGSLLAFTVYGWLLRVAPLSMVSTYAYVNPVVAVILGGVILSEPIEPRTIVAGAVIVLAVALIISARGRMRPARGVVAEGSGPAHRPATRAALPTADATLG